jgi:hypothetical protein
MTLPFPVPPPDAGSDDPNSLRRFTRSLSDAIRGIMGGKINATTTLTLTPSAATTTLQDARLTSQSVVTTVPLTASAAAEKGNGTLYVSARGAGTVTFTHANSGVADRTYAVSIIG